MNERNLQVGSEPPRWALSEFSIRPLQAGDHFAWSEYLSDRRVTLHTSWSGTDRERIALLVERCIAAYADASSCRWALVNEEGSLIGTCGYSNWSRICSHAELVYDLAPDYWRRGFMLQAVNTVLNWAFTTAGFNRVHAVTMDTNVPSIQLLDRARFSREGLLRQYRIAHGEPRDFFMYSMLREEWSGGGDVPDRRT